MWVTWLLLRACDTDDGGGRRAVKVRRGPLLVVICPLAAAVAAPAVPSAMHLIRVL